MFKKFFITGILLTAVIVGLMRRDVLIMRFFHSFTVQAMQSNPGIVENVLPAHTLSFVRNFTKNSDEVTDLLGINTSKKYFVALMNTSEKRPDGGFFGSYALVKLGPTNFSVEFFDSYYPQTVKNIVEPVEPRVSNIFDTKSVPFVGANIVGFTHKDGEILKNLYEKTFDETIDGIIFVKSDLFASLIDNFDVSTQRREFLNTTVDLRRGQNLPNKKEDYLRSLKKTFSGPNLVRIFGKFIEKLPNLVDAGYVRVYIPSASQSLTINMLENNLISYYDKQKIYVYDYNLGFNKADKFVQKDVDLQTPGAAASLNDQNQDIVEIPQYQYSSVSSGNNDTYSLSVNYKGVIPDDYVQRIEKRSDEEQITLTQREKVILSLEPQWYTLSLAYLPIGVQNVVITGDCHTTKDVITPFARVVGCSIASDKEVLDEKWVVEFTL